MYVQVLKPVAAGTGVVSDTLQRLMASVKNGLDMRVLARTVTIPLLALLLFLAVWEVVAGQIKTSLGHVPGPVAIAQQALRLVEEHNTERRREKDSYQCQRERLAEELAQDAQTKTTLIPLYRQAHLLRPDRDQHLDRRRGFSAGVAHRRAPGCVVRIESDPI